MPEIIARGIDVSWAQGKIDWQKVKSGGDVDFAIIRSGYGWDNDRQIDSQFRANVEGCLANGIPFGLYHYSYAWSVEDARCEARWFLKIIKDLKPEYPVFWDYEEQFQVGGPNNQGFPLSKQMEMIEAWLEIVQDVDYLAALYTSGSVLKRLRNAYAGRMDKFPIWVAHVNVPQPMSSGSVWQYSWKGCINGIGGDVDLNYSYEDFPKIIREAGLNGWEKAQSNEPDNSIMISRADLDAALMNLANVRQERLTAEQMENSAILALTDLLSK